MKIVNIRIGEFYRVKHNSYAWARAVRIIPPMTPPNNTRATIVECEWIVNKENVFYKLNASGVFVEVEEGGKG